MKIEHFACNVPDPVAMADWYVQHLGMKLVRSGNPPINARFLADESGSVMIEIYCNEKAPIPDYTAMDPLVMHLAFVSEDVPADCRRLVEAGATVVDAPMVTPSGDHLAMLRDPWGVAIQLCRRATPMI